MRVLGRSHVALLVALSMLGSSATGCSSSKKRPADPSVTGGAGKDAGTERAIVVAEALELCTGPFAQVSWPTARELHWKVEVAPQRSSVVALQTVRSEEADLPARLAPVALEVSAATAGQRAELSLQLQAAVIADLDLWETVSPGTQVLRGKASFQVPAISAGMQFELQLRIEADAGEDFELQRGGDTRWAAYLCGKDAASVPCRWRVALYDCEHPAGRTSTTRVALKDGELEFEIFRLNQPDAPLTRVSSVTGQVRGVDLSTNDYFELLYAINHPLGSIEGYAVLRDVPGGPFAGVVVEGVGDDAEEPVRAYTVDRAFNELEALEVVSTERR